MTQGKRTPPEVRAAVVADYLAGMSSAEVAEKHGVGPWSVTKWVRSAGEKVRPAGAPSSYREEEVALTGGAWVRDGLVMRWQPFIAPSKANLSDRERRVEWEDATVSEDDARALHARYFNGCREPRTIVGERVYQRRKKRAQYAKRSAA